MSTKLLTEKEIHSWFGPKNKIISKGSSLKSIKIIVKGNNIIKNTFR